MGAFFWLSTYTLFIEYSCLFKHQRGMFVEPFPWYVKVIGASYFGVVILGGVYAAFNGLKAEQKDNKKSYYLLDPLVQVEST